MPTPIEVPLAPPAGVETTKLPGCAAESGAGVHPKGQFDRVVKASMPGGVAAPGPSTLLTQDRRLRYGGAAATSVVVHDAGQGPSGERLSPPLPPHSASYDPPVKVALAACACALTRASPAATGAATDSVPTEPVAAQGEKRRPL
jgi:hypothetical protein